MGKVALENGTRGYLSILLGPVGLMLGLAAIVICVQGMRLGRDGAGARGGFVIGALTVGLSALGACLQLWLAGAAES